MAGPNLAYDTTTLRLGSERHTAAADLATSVHQTLSGVSFGPEIFGEVPAAGAFSANASRVRDTQVQHATLEASRRGDLAHRTMATAGLGDQLTDSTTAIAQSVPSAPELAV